MRAHLIYVVLALLLPVQNAWASKSLAPSWSRALCERILIKTGVWRPTTKAQIQDSIPETQFDPKSFYVRVKSPNSEEWVTFSRTNRDFFELKEFRYYPDHYLQYDGYKGLKLLDLACGDGQLVEKLRQKGIEAMGLDALLDPYQRSKPYYVGASAHETGLPSNSFDVVFSTQGPITYLPDNRELVTAIFAEIHRILKPGGRALLSPVDQKVIELLPAGLKVLNRPSPEWLSIPAENTGFREANYWLELVKAK